jgi:hypothetical protein
MCRLALVLAADLDSRDSPEVVAGILALAVDQQILFFINQVLPLKLPHLEIGCELNSVSRAGLFAITTEDATREVDAEKLRVAPAVLILGRLKRDAIDGTCHRTKVTGHAPLASVRVARENNPAPEARRQVRFLLWILNRDSLLERVKEDVPDCPKYAEHLLSPREHCRAGYKQVD